MRNLLSPAAALSLALAAFGATGSAFAAPETTPPAPAAAAKPQWKKIYEGPTQVNLGGRPVLADIKLLGEMTAAQKGALHLALVTDVTKHIAETKQDLKNWIATHREECGNRWAAGEPLIAFPSNAIRFAVELKLEVWNCGLNGQGEPGRLAFGSGRVDVTLIPYIEAGRLQAKLGSIKIDKRQGFSKLVPFETLAKFVLDRELKNLNENPKFWRAPKPLLGEGFKYEGISAKSLKPAGAVITARYVASGKPAAFDRLAAKVKADGISQ